MNSYPISLWMSRQVIFTSIDDAINNIVKPLTDFMERILFWDPFAAIGLDLGAKVPFIVVWLMFGALFFTIYFKFINVRGFKHAIDLAIGKFDKENESGEISHFQAIATACASTVGLGNIAGVAIAIAIGGPGVTFWMILAGLLGMTSKFTECTLGVKYRKIDKNGVVSGGPMYYLRDGLAKRGWKKLGIVLSFIFALFLAFGAMGIGNMFQSNQVAAQAASLFPSLANYRIVVGIVFAVLAGIVIVGGIKSVARVSDKLFPVMAIAYIAICLVIIGLNARHLGTAFQLIFDGAFSPEAAKGGFVGVLIMGFRRAAFSNEAGIGSAAIAHATVKTKKPITEGFVSLLEPFIDTVVICTMTALVIIITGVYANPGDLSGAQLTSAAFETVSPWFSYLLLPIIALFAFTTLIAWSYYGAKGFDFLLGGFCEKHFSKRIIATRFYQLIFLSITILGSVLSISTVIDFSDMLILAMAVPNILGLLIMAPEVKRDLKEYMKWKKEVTRKKAEE